MQLFCLLPDNFCLYCFIWPNSKRASSLHYTEEMRNMNLTTGMFGMRISHISEYLV